VQQKRKLEMKNNLPLFLLLSILSVSPLRGQEIKGQRLERLARDYALDSWELFRELLSIPNDAHFPEDIEKNVRWMESAFQSRGFRTERLETETVPLVLAGQPAPAAEKTVLIYLQIDGQPVDPGEWHQEDPWQPVLKAKQPSTGAWEPIPWRRLERDFEPEWRVFARSASDAKGPVAMFLAALDAIAATGRQPNYNLKVIMDFEEELGSPHLPKAVRQNREKLAADMLIILDGPRHISNRPTLTFGARGISTITVTVFGPRTPQHSGHYGNYAPNPAMRLAELLASMKDDEGRVAIPGFYDGIELDEKTKELLAQVPDDEAQIRRSIGIAGIDKVGRNYQEAIQYPSLNVRGMAAGWVGDKVRTIIPATATAEIDIRTVLESDPARLLRLVREHVESKGYHLINDREPTEEERAKFSRIASWRAETSYQSFRTDFNSEVGRWLDRALTRAFGQTPVKIRNSGGSIPISPFVNTLNIPAVTVPTVNRDNNQHSPNENIRLGNYVDGVKTFIAILTEPL
jgi:acetylornithine deacetylase/succinyl-diaminopimelate desuccinylase-like protein